MTISKMNKNQIHEHLIKLFIEQGCVEKDHQKRGYYISSKTPGYYFLYSDGKIRQGFSKPYSHISSFWQYKKDAISFYDKWLKKATAMKRQEEIDREEKSKHLENFYAVWRKSGNSADSKRIATKKDAILEASRLSKKTVDSYYILKTIGIVKQVEAPIEFEEIP